MALFSKRALTLLAFAPSLAWAQQPTVAAPVQVTAHDRAEAQRAFERGGEEIQKQELDKAVADFSNAAALDPNNADYAAAREIARDNLATQLMQKALKAKTQGDQAAFQSLMLQAAQEDSRNPLVVEHRTELAAAADTDDEVELNQVEGTPAQPVSLDPEPGRHSFHTDQSATATIRQVLGAYGIQAMLDSSVAAGTIHFDADQADFAQALQMVELATNTFIVPLDPARALVVLDTREKRDEFERQATETVYVPGADTNTLNDVSNVARSVFSVDHVSLNEGKDTLTLRAPASMLPALNLEVHQLLEARSSVMLDVSIYEVERQYTANVGAQLPDTTNIFNVPSEVNSLIAANPTLVQQIISSGLASPGNLEEIALALVLSGEAGSTLLSGPFAVFGGGLTLSGLTLNSSTANAVLTDEDVRMLDHVQLHLLDQEEGSVKVGESYPIITSTYSNLATGSTSISGITAAGLSSTLQNLGVSLSELSSAASASVPQVQYQDIGLMLNATPRVMGQRGVSLKLRFQLSSLTGQTLDGNPILNNRQVESILQVKPGEQTVVVSQLSHQENATLIGLPFLSEIPGFTLGTERDVTRTKDAIVIIITPYVLRSGHRYENGPMVLLPVHS